MSPNLEGFGLTSLCFPDIYFSQRKTFYQNPYIHQSFTKADLLTGSFQDSYSGNFLQNPLWPLFLTDCDVGSDFDFQGLWLAESWLVNFRFNGTWMEVTCWSRFHCFWLCSSMGKCCSVWFEVLVRTGTFIPATPVSLQTASTCCFGWPTSWWSTVLGISSDLHISMSARIIMADWLFCGDPCTTLGRSTGKWVGPSRHHNHFPQNHLCMLFWFRSLWLSLDNPIWITHTALLPTWLFIVVGTYPISQFQDVAAQINFAFCMLKKVDPNNESIPKVGFHYIPTIPLVSQPQPKFSNYPSTHPRVHQGIL